MFLLAKKTVDIFTSLFTLLVLNLVLFFVRVIPLKDTKMQSESVRKSAI